MRYEMHMRRTFIPFTTTRILPYCGITFLLALVAHNRASDVSLIAYVLAIYSVLAVIVSMSLGATGNLIAEHVGDPQEKARLFRGGFSVAMLMALVALLLGLLMLVFTVYLPGAQMDVSSVYSLSAI